LANTIIMKKQFVRYLKWNYKQSSTTVLIASGKRFIYTFLRFFFTWTPACGVNIKPYFIASQTNCGIRASPGNMKPRMIRMNKSNTFFFKKKRPKVIDFSSQSKHFMDWKFLCWFSTQKTFQSLQDSKWILVGSNKKWPGHTKLISLPLIPTFFCKKTNKLKLIIAKWWMVVKGRVFFPVKPQEAFKNKCKRFVQIMPVRDSFLKLLDG